MINAPEIPHDPQSFEEVSTRAPSYPTGALAEWAKGRKGAAISAHNNWKLRPLEPADLGSGDGAVARRPLG
jgi:hypothetical protein